MRDDEWRSSELTLTIPDVSLLARQGQILVYESSKSYEPAFIDEPGEHQPRAYVELRLTLSQVSARCVEWMFMYHHIVKASQVFQTKVYGSDHVRDRDSSYVSADDHQSTYRCCYL